MLKLFSPFQCFFFLSQQYWNVCTNRDIIFSLINHQFCSVITHQNKSPISIMNIPQTGQTTIWKGFNNDVNNLQICQ